MKDLPSPCRDRLDSSLRSAPFGMTQEALDFSLGTKRGILVPHVRSSRFLASL